MTKKPNIAVITGGDSSEFIISLKSGANVYHAIDAGKYTPWLVRMKDTDWHVMDEEKKIAKIDKSDFSFVLNGKKIRFDFAYITIHGTPGEDGILQGYFDLLKIPYSTSDLHSSSLTFNKWYCNQFLKNFGISMPRSFLLTRGVKTDREEMIKRLGFPLFVKPNAGGSSFGITKVMTDSDLGPALEKAWEESHEALVDEYIAGTEYTCGLMDIRNRKMIFPVTEVIPKNEFFDFDAKYTPGATEEITPARLPGPLYDACQQLSAKIYDLCHCSGIVRIDFILKGKKFYFLELNTTPGMTETSFIPQQIKAMGLTLKEVISMIIEDRLQGN